MLHSNPNIDYVKFGEILSSCSQDIEQKQKSDINQGPYLCYKFATRGPEGPEALT